MSVVASVTTADVLIVNPSLAPLVDFYLDLYVGASSPLSSRALLGSASPDCSLE